jgi:hypothetical protein
MPLQCELLGQWYVQQYIHSGAVQTSAKRVFWRCSKSDRAKESGEDFVRGFNSELGYEAVGPQPEFYSVDADNYFRPWKVFKDCANVIKDRQNTAEVWKTKAAEEKEFLKEVFTAVGALPSLIEKPQKALWACTYLYAVREVEEYWPQVECERDEFSRFFPSQHEERVTQLALWVWEQRFLHSGFTVEMGGRMAVDILEVSLLCSPRPSLLSLFPPLSPSACSQSRALSELLLGSRLHSPRHNLRSQSRL